MPSAPRVAACAGRTAFRKGGACAAAGMARSLLGRTAESVVGGSFLSLAGGYSQGMTRIDITSSGALVAVDGADADGELQIASEQDVTFPGVWKDGQRIYDVEVWRDGEVIVTVPPQSEEVDASFAEHERRRA
jgi:hypothetical protein